VLAESVAQTDGGDQPVVVVNFVGVRIERSDVDAALFLGPFDEARRSAPASSISIVTRSRCAMGSRPPTLKTPPLHASTMPARRNASDDIVDVDEIAHLRSVAVHLISRPSSARRMNQPMKPCRACRISWRGPYTLVRRSEQARTPKTLL
jgi:hypothetical protein